MSLKTIQKTKSDRASVTYKTKQGGTMPEQGWSWWLEQDPHKRADQLCATVAYLKQGQGHRQRQAAMWARMYGGQPLFSFVGANLSKMDQTSSLAPNRPVYNLIAAITNTLVAKITQARPTPVFLTDGGDYKERNLAKKLNNFILGEFYQTKAYEKAAYILRDSLVLGDGVLKVLEKDNKVALERILNTELFVDLQESAFEDPRRLYQVKLLDRQVAEALFPDKKLKVADAERATIDNSTETSKSVADLIMVVEGWALPSSPGGNDGMHTIACSQGELFSEPYKKDFFPFVFLPYQKRLLGWWSQGVAENQAGSQVELNSMLDTISKSIKLLGVPRVFYEEGSKFNKASFNNKIGTLIPYRGAPPIVDVSQCVPQEMYAERDSIIKRAFESEGLSIMSATGQKPMGLDSGEAQRVYQDINSERFADLEKRYSNFFVDLAYQVIDKAKDIANREGKYQTVYPDKKGTKEIDLPKLTLLEDPFVIQAYSESSLPNEPAGRMQKVTEMIQAGMISIQEGRRLLDYPDLQQDETLANASQERIFCYLDEIIEKGDYTPPDPFMNLALAEQIVVQYINLYTCRKLEESKAQLLRDWFTQIQALKAEAMQPPPGTQPPPNVPQAQPVPQPQSPLVPNGTSPNQAQ